MLMIHEPCLMNHGCGGCSCWRPTTCRDPEVRQTGRLRALVAHCRPPGSRGPAATRRTFYGGERWAP
eukprot:scaffold2764_cov399-Prasinococcus_capsulatus_cf.AAC.8